VSQVAGTELVIALLQVKAPGS